MAEMIATLSDACEREFGFLATRLFRVFKTEETQGETHTRSHTLTLSLTVSYLLSFPPQVTGSGRRPAACPPSCSSC